jgi:hypothetical protein
MGLWLLPQSGLAEETTEHKNYNIDIGINREAPEVGKRRIELLDKMLSPELIKRRREIVRQFEDDYNRKIGRLLQEITSQNSKNTVITHVDLHLFDPGFKEQVEVEQDVSVSAVLGQAGFELWRRDMSEEQALDKLRQIISASFKIPTEHISLIVGP